MLHFLLIRIRIRLGLGQPEKWRVRPRQVLHPLTARLGASSDMSVFSQIFQDEEYASLLDLPNVLVVLDLGANVGFSSAYFLSSFPQARLLAVEPDERNLAVCKLNLTPYGNRVTLLHGAAWKDRTRLNLSRPVGEGREWATQVVRPADDGGGDIEAWDVGSLIEMAGAPAVDLLKVDIEGAELAVFGEKAERWLPKVRNICIELHSQDCKKTFFDALAGFDYTLNTFGELTICRDLRLKTTAG